MGGGREHVSWAHHLQSLSRSPPPAGLPPPSPTAQHRRTDIIVAVSRKRSADGTVIVQFSCRPVACCRPAALRHPLGVSVVDPPFTSLPKCCAFADGTHSTTAKSPDRRSLHSPEHRRSRLFEISQSLQPPLKSGENRGELLPPDQPPA
ncbi:unnamed protein product [Macrosiphum euphorbiae]|uniref:Uncharacterized protein n=1 Tax=Macrosiphum euphorbiae TaxID=13131 RepID=A0AAV0VZT9_9HEMI|nr:unnamed protein product [Macrosiphum euphorbiae]